jgi:hypothetical protein
MVNDTITAKAEYIFQYDKSVPIRTASYESPKPSQHSIDPPSQQLDVFYD